MRYLLLVLVVCSVGILMIPNAFAVNERTVEVKNAPGSSVPGCEETNGCFLPDRSTIRPGDTVVWTNPDTMSHFVTSGTASDGPDGDFDSGIIMPGLNFSYQFTKSGFYNYFCSAHPWMEGAVIVREGPDWTPPSSSSPPSSSTSKIPTILKLDVIDNTFKLQGPDSKVDVIITGQLSPCSSGCKIKLVTSGFTLSEPTLTTVVNGKFGTKISFSKEFVGKQMSVHAVFDGDKKLKYSKSQTEYFTILSKSSTSTSSVGGPTFLKLEVETDERTVTISGKLTDKATKKFVVRNEAITLIPSGFSFGNNVNSSICLSSYLPNCVLKTNTGTGEFAVRVILPHGNDYSVHAVFHGNNQWDSSKSLTQSFAVTSLSLSTSSSQPQTSTSSGDFGWIWILIILGVVFAGVAAVLAKKNKKKTPTTAPQRKTFGVKQPKKRRTGSPASVPPSGKSASTFAHYECPNCHSENVVQNPNGSELCSDCGWKS